MFIYKLIIGFMYLISKPFASQAKGLENLPKSNGFIVAMNHQGAYDPLMMLAALKKFAWKYFLPRNKRFYFIGGVRLKQKILNYHFLSIAINIFSEKIAYLPANKQGLKKAIELLKAGNIIIITPEGHINSAGQLLRGKKGVALMALYSGAPVVPTGCFSSPAANVWQFIKGLIKEKGVVFGKSIFLPRFQLNQDNRFDEKLVDNITDIIMSNIARVCNKHYEPIQQK